MTGRERLTRILHRQGIDRPTWSTLVDDKSRSLMPEAIRRLPVLDFYRHVGCDILQFGNYGLPPETQVARPVREAGPNTTVETDEADDGTVTLSRHTPRGVLQARSRGGHPTGYPVATVEQVRMLQWVWQHTSYHLCDQRELRASWTRAEEAIGDDGLFAFTFGPTPVQQLLQLDMGLENFYCLLMDHEAEMVDLLGVMQARQRQEWELAAAAMPGELAIIVENTSTTMISPDLYQRLSVPQVRDFVEIMHRHGKKAVIHMCGHLRDLLVHMKPIGFDGINMLTPPPTGNTPFEDALDVLGDDLLIFPGLLPEALFSRPHFSPQHLHRGMDQLHTSRLGRAHIFYHVVADGLPTPIEHFYAVRDWFQQRRSP